MAMLKGKFRYIFPFIMLFTLVLCSTVSEAQTPVKKGQPDTRWYTGNKTAMNYTISTPEQLAGLAQLVNDGTDTFDGKTITLSRDIDLSGFGTGREDFNEGKGWIPIGLGEYVHFMGTFDGNGKTITNLQIDDVVYYEYEKTEPDYGYFETDEEEEYTYDENENQETMLFDLWMEDWMEDHGLTQEEFDKNIDEWMYPLLEDWAALGWVNIPAERYSEETEESPSDETTSDIPTYNHVGLFGYLYGGTVKNLVLKDVNIKGSGYVGSVAGELFGGALIENCHAGGTVGGTNNVGGIAGTVNGHSDWENYLTSQLKNYFTEHNEDSWITHSSFTGLVTSEDSQAGGIAGRLAGGHVMNCFSSADVRGAISVGGLVGWASGTYFNGSKIINSYATGNVISSTYSAGGIAGLLSDGSAVTGCYATGSVSGIGYVGGIVGQMWHAEDTVENCAALNVSVKGASRVGRILGSGDGILSGNKAYTGMTNGGGMAVFTGDASTDGADGEGIGANTILADGTMKLFTDAVWITQKGKLPGFGAAIKLPAHINTVAEESIHPNGLPLSTAVVTVTPNQKGYVTYKISNTLVSNALKKLQAEAARFNKIVDDVTVSLEIKNTQTVRRQSVTIEHKALESLQASGCNLNILSSVFRFTISNSEITDFYERSQGNVTITVWLITPPDSDAGFNNTPEFGYIVVDGEGNNLYDIFAKGDTPEFEDVGFGLPYDVDIFHVQHIGSDHKPIFTVICQGSEDGWVHWRGSGDVIKWEAGYFIGRE